MTVRYSTGCLNQLLGTNPLQTIFANGAIDIYPGSQPGSADNAASGTKLATVSLDPDLWTEGVATYGIEFDAPVLKVLSKAAAETWKYKGLATGTAGWARLRGLAVDNELSSTTLPRIDFSIGQGSGDMSLSNINIVLNAPGTIDTFNITLS